MSDLETKIYRAAAMFGSHPNAAQPPGQGNRPREAKRLGPGSALPREVVARSNNLIFL
jgi:hypothetical protein